MISLSMRDNLKTSEDVRVWLRSVEDIINEAMIPLIVEMNVKSSVTFDDYMRHVDNEFYQEIVAAKHFHIDYAGRDGMSFVDAERILRKLTEEDK